MSNRAAPTNVVSFVAKQAEPNRPSRPLRHQLELSLDATRALALIAPAGMHGVAFVRLLSSLRPAVVLDLRHAPHFEFPAMPGSRVREALAASGARYVQHSVPMHAIRHELLKHAPAKVVHDALSSAFDGLPRQGPLLVLVQEQEDVEAIGPYIYEGLNAASGQSWTWRDVSGLTEALKA